MTLSGYDYTPSEDAKECYSLILAASNEFNDIMFCQYDHRHDEARRLYYQTSLMKTASSGKAFNVLNDSLNFTF